MGFLSYANALKKLPDTSLDVTTPEVQQGALTGEENTGGEVDDEEVDKSSDDKVEPEAVETQWSFQSQLPGLRHMTLQSLRNSQD